MKFDTVVATDLDGNGPADMALALLLGDELVLAHTVGGALGFLLVGVVETDLPDQPRVGLTQYTLPIAPPFALPIQGAPGGVGVSVFLQVFAVDPTVTPRLSASNGRELILGN